MTESNEYTVDKDTWPDGPWMSEPDKLVWTDEATDLDCMIVRSPVTGALCGYVGVPHDHPYHHQHYDDCLVDVHGGLTYSDKCQDNICHVPEPGREHDLWWLGFDCAHLGDRRPAMEVYMAAYPEQSYRPIAYVRDQVADLAKQLRDTP